LLSSFLANLHAYPSHFSVSRIDRPGSLRTQVAPSLLASGCHASPQQYHSHKASHTCTKVAARYDNFLLTKPKARLCVSCGVMLEKPPRGRMPRFCGAACRMAAYRRRRQKLSEKTPRWDRPRGRLRLSRLQAFEREQITQRVWERKRARQRRSQTQQPTRAVGRVGTSTNHSGTQRHDR
jgi:hypothetical protein